MLEPGSVRDVVEIVRYCREHRLPLSARGRGHSTGGQAQAAGGLVIDMGGLRDVEVRDGHALVQAGALWSDLVDAALAKGRTPPVLTDYLGLSVGGTLSAGGLGGASQVHGAQVDNVLELEVVTGEAELAVCSRSRRPDLFHAALAGLGQCAVITRATVRLRPAPAMVRRYQLRYPSVTALTADQRRLAGEGRFDHVEGQVWPDASGGWRHLLEAAAFHDGEAPPGDAALLGGLSHEDATRRDEPYAGFPGRLAASVEDQRSTGEWARPHPWLNLFLPGTATDSFAGSAIADLRPAGIGASGMILLYPVRRSLLRAPLLRVPDDEFVFLFSLLRTASPGATAPSSMIEANRRLYERARRAGGTQYPVGTIPMAQEDWRAHYGPEWARFAEAKRRYDPAGILTPGPGIF